VTSDTDVGSLATATAALALRFASGVAVVGWLPALSFTPPAEEGAYALKLGPLFLSDSSAVLRGECARPAPGSLVLYEVCGSQSCIYGARQLGKSTSM
jgi:hypothetical protein